ncbi:hypothetical protein D3C85_901130 [compost metagenome]
MYATCEDGAPCSESIERCRHDGLMLAFDAWIISCVTKPISFSTSWACSMPVIATPFKSTWTVGRCVIKTMSLSSSRGRSMIVKSLSVSRLETCSIRSPLGRLTDVILANSSPFSTVCSSFKEGSSWSSSLSKRDVSRLIKPIDRSRPIGLSSVRSGLVLWVDSCLVLRLCSFILFVFYVLKYILAY